MATKTLAENVAQVKADFKSIKDAVPYIFGVGTPTSQYGEKIQSEILKLQYQADNNYGNGYESGIEQGRQEQYDEFWDAYQRRGARNPYQYAFSYGFNNDTFKPKYDIKPTRAEYLFYGSHSTLKGNLKEILRDCGVTLDLSNATSVSYAFAYSGFDTLPVVDASTATNTDGLFGWNSYVKNIEKVIFKSDGSTKHTTWFQSTPNLEEIRFDGIIGQDINMQWSTKLSIESLISLFKCIKWFVEDDSNYMKKTLTLSSESWALTESQEFVRECGYTDGKSMCQDMGWKFA